jgi:hypothetical protein
MERLRTRWGSALTGTERPGGTGVAPHPYPAPICSGSLGSPQDLGVCCELTTPAPSLSAYHPFPENSDMKTDRVWGDVPGTVTEISKAPLRTEGKLKHSVTELASDKPERPDSTVCSLNHRGPISCHSFPGPVP